MGTDTLLTILFAGVAAVTAVANVMLTWWLAAETKRMRAAATEPHVSVALVSHEYAMGFVDLVIRNHGAGGATAVRFEVVETGNGEPDQETLKALTSFGFVKNGIEYLPPGGEFRTYLVHVVGRSEPTMETNLHIRVKYKSATGQRYEECYPIDLRPFWHRMRAGDPPLQMLLKETKLVRTELERMRRALERKGGESETTGRDSEY